MRSEKIYVIVILLFAIAVLGIPQSVSADKKVVTVIDVNGVETKVYNLILYEYWGYTSYGYSYDSHYSMKIRRGESELTIPFRNIKEMKFEWSDSPTVIITTLSGEKFKDDPFPGSESHKWVFEGETGFGDFALNLKSTKKVTFSNEITPTSPTPTDITTAPTPTLTPTVLPSATSTPIQTPTSSPEQVPTLIPKPAGFEALFAFAGLLAVVYSLRRRE